MVAGIVSRISCNDAVLLVSIAYSSFDLLSRWSEFRGCDKPIQWQLIVSYMLVITFRVSHFVGQSFADDGEDFLLNFRHKQAVPWFLMRMTWAFTLPLFIVWTGLGSVWLYDVHHATPQCLPTGTQTWFLLFWQFLSYLWIMVHIVFCSIACGFEYKIRAAERDVQQLEQDSDAVNRWGPMSAFAEYGAVPWKKKGLSAADIKKLPLCTHQGCEAECSICLNDVQEGDEVRTLPGCGHSFHRACIDLWVLRCAECPLCKREVMQAEPHSAVGDMTV